MAESDLRRAWHHRAQDAAAGRISQEELETALNVVDEFQDYAASLDAVGLGNDEAPFTPLLHALPERKRR